MKEFRLKLLNVKNIESELENIGFDNTYRKIASEKFEYKNIKIFNLTPPQVNILKQTALSLGADCASNREVITGNIEESDVILGGSYSQIRKIAEKLKFQPFSLKILSDKLFEELSTESRETKLVGIVNVTPDSFSDGGKFFKPEDAIAHAFQLIDDGADILDIGAESTRPNAKAVSDDEQIRRLKPVLQGLTDIDIPISVDTRCSKVAEYVLDNGAKIINDVSGLTYDKKMTDIIAKYNATVIIQHTTGTPDVMNNRAEYRDIVEDVYLDLYNKVESAKSNGINNIIADIGIGFGKIGKQNFELLNRIEEFYSLKVPIMVGVSRKSFLGLNNSNDNGLKDALTLAVSYPLIQKKVDFLRVHNVKIHKQLLNLTN